MGVPAGWRVARSHDGTRVGWRVDGPSGALRDGRVRGDRVAVVLCNGVTCDDTYWRHIWPPLAREGPVVRFAYRAHANSEPPADPDAVGVADAVGDLAAVLDAAGVERAVLVGHSYGVKVAWEGWRALSDRVVGLAAVAGSVFRPMPKLLRRNLGVFVFDGMRQVWTRTPVRYAWPYLLRSRVAYPLSRAVGFVGPKAPRRDMEDWFDQLAERDMEILFRMMRDMQAHSGAPLLPEVDVPAVIILGARDLFSPPFHGRHMVDRMPDARLVVVPGATHVLPIEAPDVVVREIRGLLERIRATAA